MLAMACGATPDQQGSEQSATSAEAVKTCVDVVLCKVGTHWSTTLCKCAAGYDDSCGGFVAHPVECDTGLDCSHVDANGHRINPDLPGVCLEGPGQHCGGFVANPHACASPLKCHLNRNPDTGGNCE
jgi:hypothetical protein